MVLITGSKTPLVAAVLLLALVAPFPYFGGLIPPVHSATNSTITFAASGDIGSLASTTSARILSRLGASGVGFFLGLGDFSYDPSVTGDIWCGQFKGMYSNIEIFPGDHDTGGHNSVSFGEAHSYERYVNNCSFTLDERITCGRVAGVCCSKCYYSGYAAASLIALFIIAFPKIENITAVCILPPY